MVVFYLLNEHESRVVVKVVVVLIEMFVKHESTWSGDVISMRVESLVCRGFCLSDVLVFPALDAIAEINAVAALAVEPVSDLEDLSGLLALEILRRCNLAATFILGG